MSEPRRRIRDLEAHLGRGRPAAQEPAPIYPRMTPAQAAAALNELIDAGAIPPLGSTATRRNMEAAGLAVEDGEIVRIEGAEVGRIGAIIRYLIEERLVYPPPDPDSELRALIEW